MPRRRRLLDLGQRYAPRDWSDLLGRMRQSLTYVARLTTGGVLAYLLTLLLTDGPIDLTGSLTALLVMQASAYSTLRMGIVRVGAVLTGVLVAVALSTWVGLTWWSLALAIAASLLLAMGLRLGAQTLETAISAMLILGLGGQEVAAETRVVTTLIGAGVGILFNLVLPPPLPTRAAADAVHEVGTRQAEPLTAASGSMAERPITRPEVTEWLEKARAVSGLIAEASTRVGDVKDVRWLNPRAIGTADVEPALRTGLDALERSLLAVRALFQVMLKDAPETAAPEDGYGEEIRAAFAVVLAGAADCLNAFGALVRAEAQHAQAEVEQHLAESLEAVGETRAILAELLLVDPRTQPGLWLLRGSILTAVEQIIEPLDLVQRERLRRQWQAERGAGRLLPAALLVRDMLPGRTGLPPIPNLPAMPILPAAPARRLRSVAAKVLPRRR